MEEEEFGDSLSSGGSDIEEAGGEKPKGKNRQKTKARTKARAKAPSKMKKASPKTKAPNAKAKNTEESGVKLKKSMPLEPTNAFKRKAGVALSVEERKIVGIDDQVSLGDAEVTKSKKRKRPTAADWDREYPNTSLEVPGVLWW